MNFKDSMAREHSSTESFTTPNYGITTCPSSEWKIVLECDTKVEQEYSRYKRKIPDWKLLLQKESACQAKSKGAHLTDVEIIAIILYTGPMVCVLVTFKLNLNVLNTISFFYTDSSTVRYLQYSSSQVARGSVSSFERK